MKYLIAPTVCLLFGLGVFFGLKLIGADSVLQGDVGGIYGLAVGCVGLIFGFIIEASSYEH